MAQSIQNFIKSRESRWKRLEMLIRTMEHRGKKGQMAWNPLELARLYREASSDLARLQGFREKSSEPGDLEIYLNHLVGRAYGRIYRTPPPSWTALWTFLRSTFPETFIKTAPWTLTALGIFLLGGLYGFVVTLIDDAFIPLVVPPHLIQQVEEGKVWFDSILAVRPLASSMIMTNNISVCFLSFALGMTFGFGTVYIMAFNGLMLGAIAGLCHIHGLNVPFWSFVLPHGVIELTAIFISGGAGLLLGTALLAPGDLPRKGALMQRGRQAGLLALGCVPLLILAGIIEGFFSPAHVPAALKFILAGVLLLLLFTYLLRPRLIKDPVASRPGSFPKSPKQVSPVGHP